MLVSQGLDNVASTASQSLHVANQVGQLHDRLRADAEISHEQLTRDQRALHDENMQLKALVDDLKARADRTHHVLEAQRAELANPHRTATDPRVDVVAQELNTLRASISREVQSVADSRVENLARQTTAIGNELGSLKEAMAEMARSQVALHTSVERLATTQATAPPSARPPVPAMKASVPAAHEVEVLPDTPPRSPRRTRRAENRAQSSSSSSSSSSDSSKSSDEDDFDVWDADLYEHFDGSVREAYNELRTEIALADDSSRWLKLHYKTVKAEIKQHLECTPATKEATKKSLKRALATLRETYFSEKRILPQEVQMRADKLRDSNKKERMSKLVRRAFTELLAEKEKREKKDKKDKRNKKDKRGDSKPPAGNGQRGAQQQ